MSEEKENTEEKAKVKSPKGLKPKKLTEEKAYAILPFVIFMTIIAMIYIANSYFIESSIRTISKLQTELHELKAEDIELKTQLNMKTRQSEIVIKAKQCELEPLTEQPTGVLITKLKMKNND